MKKSLCFLQVFIFNRIQIVEANRTMEVLSLGKEGNKRVPLVKIKLGVGFPLRTKHTECTEYLQYLIDAEEKSQMYQSEKKRSVDESHRNVRKKNGIQKDSIQDTNSDFSEKPDSVNPKFAHDFKGSQEYYPFDIYEPDSPKIPIRATNLCGNKLQDGDNYQDMFSE